MRQSKGKELVTNKTPTRSAKEFYEGTGSGMDELQREVKRRRETCVGIMRRTESEEVVKGVLQANAAEVKSKGRRSCARCGRLTHWCCSGCRSYLCVESVNKDVEDTNTRLQISFRNMDPSKEDTILYCRRIRSEICHENGRAKLAEDGGSNPTSDIVATLDGGRNPEWKCLLLELAVAALDIYWRGLMVSNGWDTNKRNIEANVRSFHSWGCKQDVPRESVLHFVRPAHRTSFPHQSTWSMSRAAG